MSFASYVLKDDFLLRHYDSGRCKGKLGHSRASVLFHRAQVIGIFAGFGILLLVASPLLLLAAPCILCCRCKLLEKLEASERSRSRSRSASDEGEADPGGDGDSDRALRKDSSSGESTTSTGEEGERAPLNREASEE